MWGRGEGDVRRSEFSFESTLLLYGENDRGIGLLVAFFLYMEHGSVLFLNAGNTWPVVRRQSPGAGYGDVLRHA